jgi:hypothetical protein
MHPDLIHQRFRILLHILNRLGSPRPMEVPKDLGMEAAVARLELPQGDWLGYETELFRIATTAIAGLEEHLHATTTRALQEQSWWSWEWGEAARTRRGEAYRTREQAMAAAERSLGPGSIYQVGRVQSGPRPGAASRAWKDRRMLACACEGRHAGIPWRALELDQFSRLQTLIEGLVAAFLEDETILPAFMELADAETCRT